MPVSLAWHHKHKSQCLVSHKGFEVQTQAVVFAQQVLFPAELSLQSLVQHLKVSSVCSQSFTSKCSFRSYHASSIPRPQFYKPVLCHALVCRHYPQTVSWVPQGATDKQKCAGIDQDFRGSIATSAGYCRSNLFQMAHNFNIRLLYSIK